jgi:pseudaminic acid synthase
MAMTFEVQGRKIGLGCPCFVIAEMSANHDQDLERAVKLVDIAADAGADAVKVQTYRPDTMTPDTDHPSALIEPVWGAKNLFELYGKAYMPWEFHAPIFRRAKERGILAFSSPFDNTAVDLLEKLDAPLYKVASFELVDLPLLARIAQTKKPLVVSTGMATLGEIEEALEVFDKNGAGAIVLLHCCSSYPAEPGSVNLAAMETMRRAFGLPVGFSDHTVGTAIPTAAAALGAAALEKHFTDDTSRTGPDHRFSADGPTLTRMVRDIRAAEAAVGTGFKGTVPAEEINKRVGRRSIFSAVPIPKGTVVTREMIRVVRPGSGLHPRFVDVVVGRPARRDVPAGYPISWDDI